MSFIVMAVLFLNAWEVKKTYLTVYNNNFSIVSQRYESKCPKNGEIVIYGMPKTVVSDSISILMPKGFRVNSYVYRSDDEGYLKRNVEILTEDNTVIKGVLKKDGDPCVVVDEKGDYLALNKKYVKYINYGSFDEKEYFYKLSNSATLRVFTKPDLLDNCSFEARYMVNSLNWICTYDAYIDEDEKTLDMIAKVNINNSTGYDFKNASVILLAGSVNKDADYVPVFKAMAAPLAEAKADFESMEIKPDEVIDYYSYRLPGDNLEIKSGDSLSYELFSRKGVRFNKYYVYKGQIDNWYFYDNILNYRSDKKLAVIFRFKNSKENQMDIPLPEGKVRIYKKSSEFNIFAGEDSIKNTPVNSDVEIKIGKAFDVEGERRIVDHKKVMPNVYKDTIEIKIRNNKKEKIDVKVKEYLWGRWEITDSTHRYTKKDANNIEFDVSVKENSTEVIKYTARYDFNN
ncbi:MAG: DUF4139 domain-containing protein [Elusimicrobiales bacterium]